MTIEKRDVTFKSAGQLVLWLVLSAATREEHDGLIYDILLTMSRLTGPGRELQERKSNSGSSVHDLKEIGSEIIKDCDSLFAFTEKLSKHFPLCVNPNNIFLKTLKNGFNVRRHGRLVISH